MAFRIGQKVVCVAPQPAWYPVQPDIGKVYTVRDVEWGGGWPAVRLEEIVMPIMRCIKVPTGELASCEPSFYLIGRFRPVTEKQTDITAFTEILDRENRNSRVPVSDHQSN